MATNISLFKKCVDLKLWPSVLTVHLSSSIPFMLSFFVNIVFNEVYVRSLSKLTQSSINIPLFNFYVRLEFRPCSAILLSLSFWSSKVLSLWNITQMTMNTLLLKCVSMSVRPPVCWPGHPCFMDTFSCFCTKNMIIMSSFNILFNDLINMMG